MLRNVSACGDFIAKFVSDRDVHTFLFVLLRGVVSPCIVSGLWTYVTTGITNQYKYCSFGLCRRFPCSSQLFSQTVILSQPETQQENHDMGFKQ